MSAIWQLCKRIMISPRAQAAGNGAAPAPVSPQVRQNNRDLRQDRRDLRQDEHRLHRDQVERHADRQDVRQDRVERRGDIQQVRHNGCGRPHR